MWTLLAALLDLVLTGIAPGAQFVGLAAALVMVSIGEASIKCGVACLCEDSNVIFLGILCDKDGPIDPASGSVIAT